MRGLLFVSLLFLCGCFKYVPLEGPTNNINRGTELRAYLSGEMSVDLNDVTAHNIISMDVEFVRQEESELLFSAFYLDSSSRDSGYLGNGWTVRVPVENVSRIDVRKFDFWRTTGLIALAVVGSYFGWDAIAGSGDGKGLDDGSDGQVY
jgi:hypothetical protein